MADDAFAAFEAEMEALPAPKAAAGPQAPKVIMAAPSGPTRRRSPSPPKGLPSHLPPSQWQSPDELASQIRADNPGVAMPQLARRRPPPGCRPPPPPPPPGYPGAMVPPPPPAGAAAAGLCRRAARWQRHVVGRRRRRRAAVVGLRALQYGPIRGRVQLPRGDGAGGAQRRGRRRREAEGAEAQRGGARVDRRDARRLARGRLSDLCGRPRQRDERRRARARVPEVPVLPAGAGGARQA